MHVPIIRRRDTRKEISKPKMEEEKESLGPLSPGHPVSPRRSAPVAEKLQQKIRDREYYEAHQNYRALYQQYKAEGREKEALELLYEGALLLLQHGQWGSGSDLGLLMVEHLKEAKTPVDDQLLDKMGNLFSHSSGAPGNASSECTASHHTTDMECTPSGPAGVFEVAAETDSREAVLRAALKWTSIVANEEQWKYGHPKLHKMAANTYWREKQYGRAREHFLHAEQPQEFGNMLVELSATFGYAGEADLFVTQAVLQLLVLKDRKGGLAVFNTYTRKHPKFKSDNPPYLHHPTLNFVWFLLSACKDRSREVLQCLRVNYSPTINRDPSFNEYLDKIGEVFFGPPNQPQPSGSGTAPQGGIFNLGGQGGGLIEGIVNSISGFISQHMGGGGGPPPGGQGAAHHMSFAIHTSSSGEPQVIEIPAPQPGEPPVNIPFPFPGFQNFSQGAATVPTSSSGQSQVIEIPAPQPGEPPVNIPFPFPGFQNFSQGAATVPTSSSGQSQETQSSAPQSGEPPPRIEAYVGNIPFPFPGFPNFTQQGVATQANITVPSSSSGQSQETQSSAPQSGEPPPRIEAYVGNIPFPFPGFPNFTQQGVATQANITVPSSSSGQPQETQSSAPQSGEPPPRMGAYVGNIPFPFPGFPNFSQGAAPQETVPSSSSGQSQQSDPQSGEPPPRMGAYVGNIPFPFPGFPNFGSPEMNIRFVPPSRQPAPQGNSTPRPTNPQQPRFSNPTTNPPVRGNFRFERPPQSGGNVRMRTGQIRVVGMRVEAVPMPGGGVVMGGGIGGQGGPIITPEQQRLYQQHTQQTSGAGTGGSQNSQPGGSQNSQTGGSQNSQTGGSQNSQTGGSQNSQIGVSRQSAPRGDPEVNDQRNPQNPPQPPNDDMELD